MPNRLGHAAASAAASRGVHSSGGSAVGGEKPAAAAHRDAEEGSGKQAKCVFLYNARESNEISMQVGDVVEIISEDPSGWWTGRVVLRMSGEPGDTIPGLFPANYVELIVPPVARSNRRYSSRAHSAIPSVLEKEPDVPSLADVSIRGVVATVKANYAFEATEDGELGFPAGAVIKVLSKDDSGWWTGSLNGAVGLFPAAYTQPM